MSNKSVTCTKCGWVSFPVTQEYAEKEASKFAEWFSKQSEETKSHYPSKPFHYKCLKCRGDQFRPSTPKEVEMVAGCTVNPVVYEENL